MTYKNIVFDLDDTLYDHQLPFKRSVEKCFPTIDIQQIDNIYKRFRYWSDVAFPKYTKKLISIEQLRIFRCQKTMEEFGIDSISRTEALDFQADYEYELDQITMIPEIHQLLLALHKNHIPIGILTNGPVDLQSRKLQNIGAYQYFEKQNIIISQSTHGGAAENSYEGNVKNLQSYRNVQLSKRAIEILKEEIELNHQHIRFNPDYKDNGWIFTSKSRHKPDYNGTPLHYSVLNNFLNSPENGKLNRKGNPKRAGIDIDNKLSFNKHITTHIFRHTQKQTLAIPVLHSLLPTHLKIVPLNLIDDIINKIVKKYRFKYQCRLLKRIFYLFLIYSIKRCYSQ